MAEQAIVETVPDFLAEINLCESLEEFTTLGMSIRKQKDHAQWALGLLALKVESTYGEQSLASFAKNIGVSASTMQVYRWVAAQYTANNPQFTPPERLPFSVLQSVAKLPPAERETFLAKAEDESMSVERVRQEIKKSTGGTPIPKFHVVECAIHGKYQFISVDPTQWEPAHE